MAKYVFLNNEKVQEIIEEFDPLFPDIPIEDRYSPEFLGNCVVMEDEEVPPLKYVRKNDTFEKPVRPVAINPSRADLEQKKQNLLDEIATIDDLLLAMP